MYLVTTVFEAFAFLIAGAAVVGLVILAVLSIAVSHNRTFQLKIFVFQIIRGSMIACNGLMYIFESKVPKEWKIWLTVVFFTTANFCNLMSFFIFS